MLAAASNVKSINDARQANEKEVQDDDEPQLLGQATTAMTDVLDMNVSSSDQLTLDQKPGPETRHQSRLISGIRGVMKRMNARVISNL